MIGQMMDAKQELLGRVLAPAVKTKGEEDSSRIHGSPSNNKAIPCNRKEKSG